MIMIHIIMEQVFIQVIIGGTHDHGDGMLDGLISEDGMLDGLGAGDGIIITDIMGQVIMEAITIIIAMIIMQVIIIIVMIIIVIIMEKEEELQVHLAMAEKM